MSDNKQPSLIPADQLPESTAPEGRLTADISLKAAIGLFEQHMRDEGFSINTIKAFVSDLRLLGKFLGIGQPIGDIGTKDLNDFLYWLANERGVPCSPKSYARRVTTLKVFFGWLHGSETLLINPADAVIQQTVASPLPTVPTADQLARALEVTAAWRIGEGVTRPDARPHLLLTLLIKTGIKKGEAMAIVPNHVIRDDPNGPALYIRYRNPRMRYKERKVALDHAWLEVLDEYVAQYEPTDTLFTCTARNLEYILTDVGEAAGLKRGLLSFENLRWASALIEYQESAEPDQIRQRLGLSKVTWRETRKKLTRIAEKHRQGTAPDA